MCRQREDETDREYLTRWSTIRNSYDGVIESQAIAWFAQGCRHGSMLWQRLQREMPATLAETIKIADSYALGDPTQPLLVPVDRDRSGRRGDRSDYRGKRREDRPDYRYGSDQDQVDAGSSQRQKNDGPAWGQNSEGKRPWNGEKRPWNGEKRPWNGERKPWNGDKKQWDDKQRYTYEMMLDGPCSFHTKHPSRPSKHITRNCS